VKSLESGLENPITTFVNRIDLSKTRVRALGDFVLLFGGENSNSGSPVKSIRHRLYFELSYGSRRADVGRVLIPEEIKDWNNEGHYRDLVSFEEDLAGLASAIVLAIESAGSIAELGAFSMIKSFSEKMIVIVAEHHYEEESFIKNGPIRRLENEFEKSVLVYDWHDSTILGKKENYAKIESEISEIVDHICNYKSQSDSERVFKKDSPSHVMILICELCDIFGILNETEIRDYLQEIGISLGKSLISRYIFTLTKLELIATKSKGHGRYYYAPDWKPRITFGYKPGPNINRERTQTDVLNFYESQHKTKISIIKKIREAA
jgi:hypothetical protein